jgi:hypothetical protein
MLLFNDRKGKKECQTTMKSLLLTAVSSVAIAATVASAYTFDPLNGIWKPSPSRRSSSASSYAQQQPSEMEAPFAVEEEVIRAQYTTWAGKYYGGNKEGGIFQQKSLVQIEYNKKTGEISLHDQDGIVTKEDYQNLMRAITTRVNSNGEVSIVMDDAIPGLDVVSQTEDVPLGTTQYIDVEDLDESEVIDTQGEELPTMMEHVHSQEQHQPQHTQYSEFQNPQYQHQHHQEMATAAATATSESLNYSYNTYTIPHPPTETQTQTALQEQQLLQLQQMAYQQQLQYHNAQVPVAAAVSDEPILDDDTSDTTPHCGGWGFNNRRSSFMK